MSMSTSCQPTVIGTDQVNHALQALLAAPMPTPSPTTALVKPTSRNNITITSKRAKTDANESVAEKITVLLFKCGTCSFTSTSKHRTRYHEVIHSSVKPYKCSQCAYSANFSSNLSHHIKIKHSDNDNQQQFKFQPRSHPHPIKELSILSQELKKKHKQVVSHSTKKTGNRFICNDCPYSSGNLSDFKAHQYKHTGEKPFKCDYSHCEFASVHFSNFVRHQKIHARSITQFHCLRCSFASRRYCILRYHSWIKHGENLTTKNQKSHRRRIECIDLSLTDRSDSKSESESHEDTSSTSTINSKVGSEKCILQPQPPAVPVPAPLAKSPVVSTLASSAGSFNDIIFACDLCSDFASTDADDCRRHAMEHTQI